MPETNNNLTQIDEALDIANSTNQNAETTVIPDVVNAIPDTAPNTTVKWGRVATLGAAGAITAAALLGPNAVEGGNQNGDTNFIQDVQDEATEETPQYIPAEEEKKVPVLPGDGVNDVVQRAYGIEAPEDEHQVVENNPAYTEQYQAVVDANGGSEELSPGKLPLPEDFLTQEEIDRMQINQQ